MTNIDDIEARIQLVEAAIVSVRRSMADLVSVALSISSNFESLTLSLIEIGAGIGMTSEALEIALEDEGPEEEGPEEDRTQLRIGGVELEVGADGAVFVTRRPRESSDGSGF